MIHHIALFRLAATVEPAKIEWMVREARMHLLKISHVRAIRCGHNPDPSAEWTFFFTADLDSADRHKAFVADPHLAVFLDRVVSPNITAQLVSCFETDAGDNPLFW